MSGTGQPRLLGSFAALRHRNYRLLWGGTLISHSGDWLDQVALSWLVLEQTGSVLYLGIVHLCRGLPIMLFTLIGGAVADSMERRRLMMLTQSAAMVLATLLAVMVLTDNAPLWGILAVATGRGVVVAFNLPARQSLISELVPRSDLANALALNSLTINLTKVIGPLLAGIIIATWGTGICFVVNAVSFLAVLLTLFLMRFPTDTRQRSSEGVLASILSGFNFIRSDQTILLLVLVSLLPTFFGLPFQTLLGIWAYDVFDTGPEGLGVLVAATAFGSVIGAMIAASFSAQLCQGWVMLCLLCGFGLALTAFAVNPSANAAPVLLLFAGGTRIAYDIANSSILQLIVPDAYRGRVLSTLFLNRGLISLGAATWATLAAATNPRIAFATMGLSIVCLSSALLIVAPRLRQLKI